MSHTPISKQMHFGLVVVALGLVLGTGHVSASSGIPALEGPIEQVVRAFSGKIAISIATLVLVGAGFAWASSEGLAFHRLTNMVLGVSIALLAASIVATLWGSATAASFRTIPVSWGTLLLEDLVACVVHAGGLALGWRIVRPCGLWLSRTWHHQRSQ